MNAHDCKQRADRCLNRAKLAKTADDAQEWNWMADDWKLLALINDNIDDTKHTRFI